MLTKIWQLKGVFVLVGLFVAFAACVKEKDPNVDRNQIKDALGAITTAINSGDLGMLNKYFVQPTPEGAGPNRLLSLLAAGDSTFSMHNRKFSIDGKSATVSFTHSPDPADSIFSYLYLVNDGGWKIQKFEIK
jgi:hypothetical protein